MSGAVKLSYETARRNLPERLIDELRLLPAREQPVWQDRGRAEACRRELQALPGLVTEQETDRLRELTARCAAGALSVIQVGNCAEDPFFDSRPREVRRMAGLIDCLAGTWQLITGTPVVRVGRMAGQFAKPRSRPLETVGERQLPVYRGHMVNRPAPDAIGRRHLPDHMLDCYRSAERVLAELRRIEEGAGIRTRTWTSHEALVLDYELSLLRITPSGRTLLTSTHWPWVGERTRQLDGAHVRMLASVANPVACKIGPSATPADVRGLCATLNPRSEPGRLTLIARMGADRVGEVLPPLVEAGAEAGPGVLWMCDPMHANTRRHEGVKTRHMDDVRAELRQFYRCVAAAGAYPAGIHLEATPADVAECVSPGTEVRADSDRYTTLCDPRLNPDQARQAVAEAARAATGTRGQ